MEPRVSTSNLPIAVIYDDLFAQQITAESDVHSVLEELLADCDRIVYLRYLHAQIVPYTGHTITYELILNASWVRLPLGDALEDISPDRDLPLPRIDHWANGALVVEAPSSVTLRSSVSDSVDEAPITQPKRVRVLQDPDEPLDSPKSRCSDLSTSRFVARAGERPVRITADLSLVNRLFDEKKKQSTFAGKDITVDRDFNVILIQGQKPAGPAVIVPKIATRKPGKPPETVVPPRRAIRRAVDKDRVSRVQTQTLPKLVQPDVPVFDELVPEIRTADSVICAPGVTYKEGSVVKSKYRPSQAGTFTRAQYEEYVKDLEKKANE
jgi:hypothetical protein